MTPHFRKVALLAASLGLLLSLFLALRRQDDEPATTAQTVSTPGTTAETTTAPATTAPATTASTLSKLPAAVRIRLDVRSTEPGLIRRIPVKRGREVVIVVRADLSDQVHLHGYDLMAEVAPGKPARIQFIAVTPGRFEVELEDRGTLLADLEVRP